MNTHDSVKTLLTLLLLEQSPKTVDLLLEKGNEGTVGRRVGSEDPHSLVFPPSGPICSTQMPFSLLPCTPVIHHIFCFESLKNSSRRQFEFPTLV